MRDDGERTMAEKVRSLKAAQLQQSDALRGAGTTWVEIADTFRATYGVNARVALRLAHGWSQREAADRWNHRWPDDLRTFKNFSYWEQWPASTGYAPSLDVLARLAELYQCSVSDLLIDGPDYRHHDRAHQARQDLERLRNVVEARGAHRDEQAMISTDHEPAMGSLAAVVRRLQEIDMHELTEVTSAWAQQLGPGVDRRSLLLKLSFAMTMAAATPDASVGSPDAEAVPAGQTLDLAGVWRSRYVYYSSGRDDQFECVHYVVIHQDGRQVAVESLPHSSGSKVKLALTVDALTATGTWEERTSPAGYYKGATYRGAIQFLVDPSGGQMTGKWIGFGKNFAINTGDWDLTLEQRSTSRPTLRAYALKA